MCDYPRRIVAQPDDKTLMDLYRLHSDEVRFQVTLTWDRTKSSLAFHAAWVAILANMANKMPRELLAMMFAFGGVSALCGGLMAYMGHQNYRAARKRRWQIEENLGTGYGFVSTPGARGESFGFFRIYVVLILLHIMLAGLSFAGAMATWLKLPT